MYLCNSASSVLELVPGQNSLGMNDWQFLYKISPEFLAQWEEEDDCRFDSAYPLILKAFYEDFM